MRIQSSAYCFYILASDNAASSAPQGNATYQNNVLEQFCEGSFGTNQFLSEFPEWVSGGRGRMPASAAEYRLHAAECLELAKRISGQEDKARLIMMAQAFFELANKLERLEPSSK